MPKKYSKNNFYIEYTFDNLVGENQEAEVNQEAEGNQQQWIVVPDVVWSYASDWSLAFLEEGKEKGVIPTLLNNEDFTKPVTRREFAAIAVKMYERLTGTTATAVSVNPFADTDDVEVLKAYNIGITAGTSATTFEPNSQITREQMAVMMTNAVRKAMPSENTNMTEADISAKFADHQNIAGWAVSGVYYMSGRGIISGMGDNMFSAKGTATREQAMIISVKTINAFNK